MQGIDVKPQELLDQAQVGSLTDLIRLHIFNGTPTVLDGNQSSYDRICAALAANIGASPEDIRIVGSAKLGYSLSPNTFGVPFSDADPAQENRCREPGILVSLNEVRGVQSLA